ncbi:MAG TPA: energy transducer TonB [Gemmatimonadales bacterium]|nr:energy transducer TonB [Gemmatimonadales bacterium]
MLRSRLAIRSALAALVACALVLPASAMAQQDSTSGTADSAGAAGAAGSSGAGDMLGVPGVGSPASGATRDASQRDVSTYRDTDLSGVDTSRARARDTTARPAAARDTTARPTAARDTTTRDTTTLRDTTSTRDTSAARGGGRRSALEPLTEAQCDSIAQRVGAGGAPPAGTRAPAMQTWVVPDGPPPADLRSRTVMLRFQVDEGGVPVASTLVVEGSRDPAFRQRAVAALQRMQYVPADYRGCALPSAVQLPVAFDATVDTTARKPAPRTAPKRVAPKPAAPKKAAPQR